jgi:hypothetical protein
MTLSQGLPTGSLSLQEERQAARRILVVDGDPNVTELVGTVLRRRLVADGAPPPIVFLTARDRPRTRSAASCPEPTTT